MSRIIFILVSVIFTNMFCSNGSQVSAEKKQGKAQSYERRDYRCDCQSGRSRLRTRNRSRTREVRGRTPSVVNIHNGVFLNEEWLRNCSVSLGQIIIVDSGCPVHVA